MKKINERTMSAREKRIPELAEYAVKKYKSHRRVPDNILEELNKVKM